MRSKLQFYPEDGEGTSSEFWHGDKLAQGKNISQLTPMATSRFGTYYVNEVCELVDGSLFIPEMFLRRKGELWARGKQLVAPGQVSLYFDQAYFQVLTMR